MDCQIALAREELQALRQARIQRHADQSRQMDALQSHYVASKSSLEKNLKQLGMSTYKHAVLETQASAVQPYILQKLAILCHAFHHTEVITKQIQMMQHNADELETVLQNSMDQIEDFWEPRLLHLTESIRWSKQQIQEMASRLPNGSAFLQSVTGEEQKESEEPSHSAMLFSVMSMVMAARRKHQVAVPNKCSRRHSLTFLPFAQAKKPVQVACEGKAMAASNPLQLRRCSA
jgi:hypothetical protein